jgi:hypothetical protein
MFGGPSWMSGRHSGVSVELGIRMACREVTTLPPLLLWWASIGGDVMPLFYRTHPLVSGVQIVELRDIIKCIFFCRENYQIQKEKLDVYFSRVHWIAMKAKGNINRRLLVQSKWCKKKEEKSEPSRVSNPGHQFRSRTCLPLLYERLS